MTDPQDRCLQLAKIERIVGHRRWLSAVRDDHGITTPKAIVEAEIFYLENARTARERMRRRWSKQPMRAIKQFGAALRKANRPDGGLPEDLRRLLGLNLMIHMFVAYEKGPRTKPKPKRDATAQRMATLSAMRVCELLGIPLTTTRKTGVDTKASEFCQLAAVLYGNESADMHHYCREALKGGNSAKPGQKSGRVPR